MYLYFNVNEAGGVGYANRRGTFMTLYVVCINGYIMYIFISNRGLLLIIFQT